MRAICSHAPQLSFDFTFPRLRYRQLEFWDEARERLDCATYEEAVAKAYREEGSIARAAGVLTFSETTVRNKLHQMGEPVKGRGGNNNPWGCKGRPGKHSFPLFDF